MRDEIIETGGTGVTEEEVKLKPVFTCDVITFSNYQNFCVYDNQTMLHSEELAVQLGRKITELFAGDLGFGDGVFRVEHCSVDDAESQAHVSRCTIITKLTTVPFDGNKLVPFKNVGEQLISDGGDGPTNFPWVDEFDRQLSQLFTRAVEADAFYTTATR